MNFLLYWGITAISVILVVFWFWGGVGILCIDRNRSGDRGLMKIIVKMIVKYRVLVFFVHITLWPSLLMYVSK
jgi:hypothetical protein